MRKLFYLIACLSLTGLLGACNDDKENGDDGELSFKFPLTEYESAKIGGKKVIGFSTVGDWTAEVKYKVAPATVDDEWLEISPKSGNAGHWFLTLNLDENTDYDDREAEVVITSGGETKTLKVTQFSTSAMFFRKPLIMWAKAADRWLLPYKQTARSALRRTTLARIGSLCRIPRR